MISLATEHRPQDRAGFMAAARAMRDLGFKVDDIAVALQLSRNAVMGLLHEADTGEPKHQTAAPGRRHPDKDYQP